MDIIVEYEGGTYISQYHNMPLIDAVKAYNAADPSGQGAVPIDLEPIAIGGTQGVFCATGVSGNDEIVLANIVATNSY